MAKKIKQVEVDVRVIENGYTVRVVTNDNWEESVYTYAQTVPECMSLVEAALSKIRRKGDF